MIAMDVSPSPALAWLGDPGSPGRLPELTRVALALLSWWGSGARLGAAERGQLWQRGAPHQAMLARRRIDSLLYWACERDEPTQRIYERVEAAQRAATVRALTALAGAGVDVLVCKGGELVPRLVGERALHVAKDSDLLVERPRLGRARRVLCELGFQQAGVDGDRCGLVDLDPLDIAASERGHYELYPFRALVELELPDGDRGVARHLCRGPTTAADGTVTDRGPLWQRLWLPDDGRTVVAVEIDLHHRLAHEWDVDKLFARAVPSCLGAGRTLCITDHLWFTALRYYWELGSVAYRQLRPLALLGRLVASTEVDWSLACRVATSLHHAPGLYYMLSLIEQLAPGHVPPGVLAELDPASVDRRHDHGWRLARALGFVEPFPLQP